MMSLEKDSVLYFGINASLYTFGNGECDMNLDSCVVELGAPTVNIKNVFKS